MHNKWSVKRSHGSNRSIKRDLNVPYCRKGDSTNFSLIKTLLDPLCWIKFYHNLNMH